MKAIFVAMTLMLLASGICAADENTISKMLADIETTQGDDFGSSHPHEGLWVVYRSDLDTTAQILDFLRSDEEYSWKIDGVLCIFQA